MTQGDSKLTMMHTEQETITIKQEIVMETIIHELDIDKMGSKHGDMTVWGGGDNLQGTEGPDGYKDTSEETNNNRHRDETNFTQDTSDKRQRQTWQHREARIQGGLQGQNFTQQHSKHKILR